MCSVAKATYSKICMGHYLLMLAQELMLCLFNLFIKLVPSFIIGRVSYQVNIREFQLIGEFCFMK